jgi:hypothetical protein
MPASVSGGSSGVAGTCDSDGYCAANDSCDSSMSARYTGSHITRTLSAANRATSAGVDSVHNACANAHSHMTTSSQVRMQTHLSLHDSWRQINQLHTRARAQQHLHCTARRRRLRRGLVVVIVVVRVLLMLLLQRCSQRHAARTHDAREHARSHRTHARVDNCCVHPLRLVFLELAHVSKLASKAHILASLSMRCAHTVS